MKKIELLAGEPQPRESRRAMIACNDYLRLGPARQLSSLAQKYRTMSDSVTPTRSVVTLQRWGQRFNWQTRAEIYDAELEQRKNEAEAKRRAEILESGFALHYERVSALKEVADALLQEIRTEVEQPAEGGSIDIDTSTDAQRKRPGVWLRDVKQIGAGEDAEKVAIVRFNSAIFEQFRGLLDDIAKEVGERVQKTATTVDMNIGATADDLAKARDKAKQFEDKILNGSSSADRSGSAE